jgi:hypothetical protein
MSIDFDQFIFFDDFWPNYPGYPILLGVYVVHYPVLYKFVNTLGKVANPRDISGCYFIRADPWVISRPRGKASWGANTARCSRPARGVYKSSKSMDTGV